MSAVPSIDLSVIPESQHAAVLAVLRERDALRESNRRLEHLIAELNQVVHGKRSEKLNDDERQLAFEDLEAAVAEAETRQARVEDQLADAEESRDEQREAVDAARAERDEARRHLSRWT